MARARNIKPGFYKNEDLAECSVWARLIFPGLWMLADREGRMEDRPKRIKGELLPYDSVEVDPLLDELARFGFILRYELDGQRFIQICKFAEHQTPHIREQASSIPAPDETVQSTTKAVPRQCLDDGEASPRSPDSLNPSLLNPSSLNVGNAPEPVAPAAPKKSRAPAKTPLPADFCISERVQRWADEKGHRHLQRHFDHFVSACKAKGYVYADWDQALQNAIRDDWAKVNVPQARGSPGGYESAKDRSRREAAEQLTGRRAHDPFTIDITEAGAPLLG